MSTDSDCVLLYIHVLHAKSYSPKGCYLSNRRYNTMKKSNPIYGYGVGDGGPVSYIGIGLHQSASTDSHGDCH